MILACGRALSNVSAMASEFIAPKTDQHQVRPDGTQSRLDPAALAELGNDVDRNLPGKNLAEDVGHERRHRDDDSPRKRHVSCQREVLCAPLARRETDQKIYNLLEPTAMARSCTRTAAVLSACCRIQAAA